MKENNMFFKFSTVNGQRYLQIWKKEKGKSVYVCSVGTANSLYKKVVKLEFLEVQTKNFSEILTKICVDELNKKTRT